MRVARTFLIPIALVALALGCDTARTDPWGQAPGGDAPGVGTRELVLDLSASDSEGSLGHPITFQASIYNDGTASALQLQGGGNCQWIKIDILDASGQLVQTVDPCLPKVAVLVHWNASDPPEPLVRTVSFHWTGS